MKKLVFILFFCIVIVKVMAQYSGTLGSNLRWALDNGTLTIDGAGDMPDYSRSSYPWHTNNNGLNFKIKQVIIGDGVTSIGPYAFNNCQFLTSITIGNSVKSIGYAAFIDTSLSSITIPNSVTDITGAFYNCSNLTSISIPNSVTSVGNYAFHGCAKLEFITIPNSVKSIGNNAFRYCYGLTSVTIPDSVTSIESYAFCDCINLKSVIIGNGVKSIVNAAFYNCGNLKSIIIGNGVKSIEYAAFTSNNVETIYCLAIEPPVIVDISTFYPYKAILNVPKVSAEKYKNAFVWKNFFICEIESNSLTLLPSLLNFAAFGEQKTFDITSNTNWRVSSDADWVKVSPSSGSNDGTVTVTVTDNPDLKQRTATITVKGTDVESCTISVTQEGRGEYSIELLSIDDDCKPMKGVAADGKAELRIRFKYNGENPDVEKIKFTLDNGMGIGWTGAEAGFLPNEKQEWELSVTPSMFTHKNGESYLDILYTAPNGFSEGNTLNGTRKIRYIDLRVEYTVGYGIGQTDFVQTTIEIIRPPVMLVHGLGSSSATFVKLQKALQNTGYDEFQLWNVNYKGTNKVSFEDNKWVVPYYSICLRNRVRDEKYDVKKVSIVAHSMGGLLTRQYLQSVSYDDDIYRIITLNTPHSGSQCANLLMDLTNSDGKKLITYLYSLTLPGLLVANPLSEVYIRQGAISDLCVKSPAIKKLNGEELNKNKVPMHAIYTTAGLIESIKKLSFEEALVYTVCVGQGLLPEQLYGGENDYYKGENDIIVAASSQTGGLSDSFLSHFTGVMHTESTSNPSEIDKVVELLEAPHNDNRYSIGGYNPRELSWDGIPFLKIRSAMQLYEESSIRITSIDKLECKSGEEIKIKVNGSSDITSISLLIQEDNEEIYMDTKEGGNNEFVYAVPSEAIGYKKILAIGYTNAQKVEIDTAFIHISTSASLLSISTSENKLLVPLYGKQQVQVQGSYSDGTTKNISYLENVQFKIKGKNAGMETQNIIVGKKEGVDTLVVSFQGLEISLPIQVIDVGLEEVITDIEFPAKSNKETLKCYPNPAKEQLTISYELIESCSSAHLNIYDMIGQILKTVELKNKKAGYNEETISIVNIPKGMYIVVLSTDKGNSYQKLLKE